MSFFNKLFKSEAPFKEKKQLPWIPLDNIAMLDTIAQKSKDKPQVIFKHSTRCGISSMVLKRFTDTFDLQPDRVDLYYLDLLNYRDVSNEVGYRFQVLHQSPQMIIIKNDETVHHASHHNIDAHVISTFV